MLRGIDRGNADGKKLGKLRYYYYYRFYLIGEDDRV